MSKTAVVPEAVREIERKYEAPAEQEVPALGGLPGVVGEPVHRLDTALCHLLRHRRLPVAGREDHAAQA